jgi:hypothetical protein
MSPTAATANETSAVDRAQIRAALEALEREARIHFVEDSEFKESCEKAFRRLFRWQAYLMGGLAIACVLMGAVGMSFKWSMQHAVTDVLLKHGVIRYEMPHRGVTP